MINGICKRGADLLRQHFSTVHFEALLLVCPKICLVCFLMSYRLLCVRRSVAVCAVESVVLRPALANLPRACFFPLVPRSRTHTAHRIATAEHRSAGHKTIEALGRPEGKGDRCRLERRWEERLGNAVNQIPEQHRNWMMTSVSVLKLQLGTTRNSHTSTCSKCQQVVL